MTSARRPVTGLLLEVCLAVAVGVGAGWVTFRSMAAVYAPATIDSVDTEFVAATARAYMGDLLSPCVKRSGFQPVSAATVQLPEWRDFTSRTLDAFPCAALSSVPLEPAGYFADLHRHLHRAMSFVFARVGPRLIGFAYVQAIQVGIFFALIFSVFRLGMGRVLSVLAMAPLLWSPRHLEIALQPLDYAKAPAFAACLLGIGTLIARKLTPRAAAVVALLTGAAVGIGFGFKTDVLVFAPFGAVALAAFFPADGPRRWRVRAAMTSLYLAGVLLAGAPIIYEHFFAEQRSLVPVQVLGGMPPGYEAPYAEPGVYDTGVLFDDEYVVLEINSYHQRVNGSTEYGEFFSKSLHDGAFDMLFTFGRLFPADLILRTYADVVRVLQGMPGGLAVALLVFAGFCYADWRLALFVAWTIAYMVGYTSLVFAPKHYFHLEFVPWWFLGCALSQATAWLYGAVRRSHAAAPAAPARSLGAAALTAAGLISVLAGSLAIARLYQDRRVHQTITAYTQPDRFEDVPVSVTTTPAGSSLSVPEGVRLDDRPDASAAKVVTDYLRIDVTCGGARTAQVLEAYLTPGRWRHGVNVRCERAGQLFAVLWPVYQRARNSVFLGFETSPSGVLRVNRIERLKRLDGLTVLPRLVLPDDWSRRTLHHTLLPGAWSLTKVAVRPSAYPPQPLALPPPSVSWSPPFTPASETLSTRAPDLSTWYPIDGVTLSPAGGGVRVTGNNGALTYQLMSPPISVSPHKAMAVRVHGAVERGRVGVGVLEGSQQHWLYFPGYGRSDFVFNTGENTRVFIIFANTRQPADPVGRTQFLIESVSYDIRSDLRERISALLWPES